MLSEVYDLRHPPRSDRHLSRVHVRADYGGREFCYDLDRRHGVRVYPAFELRHHSDVVELGTGSLRG